MKNKDKKNEEKLMAKIENLQREVSDKQDTIDLLKKEYRNIKQYLAITDTIFVMLDREQNVSLINPKGCEILGWTEDEILGKNWFDLCIPDSIREKVKKVFYKIISGEVEPVKYYENYVLTKDKKKRLIAWHNDIYRDKQGNIIGTVSSGIDITQIKKLENIHRELEKQYEQIFNSMNEGFIVCELVFDEKNRPINYKILDANPVFVKMLQSSNEEIIGKNITEILGTGEPYYLDIFSNITESQTPISFESYLVPLKKYFKLYAFPHQENQFCVIFSDITDLKENQEKLVQLNSILHSIRNVNQLITRERDIHKLIEKSCKIMVGAGDYYEFCWIVLFDQNGNIVDYAQNGVETQFDIFVKQMKTGKIPVCIQQVLKSNEYVECCHNDKDCKDCPIRPKYQNKLLLVPMNHQGVNYGIMAVSTNLYQQIYDEEKSFLEEITGDIAYAIHHSKLEQNIRESEIKYRTVFENTGTATCILENDGTISFANNKFAELTGYPLEAILNKKTWMEFVVEEDLQRMLYQHKLRRKSPEKALREYEFRFIDRQKNIKYIHLYIDIIPGTDKSIASLLDITEQKQAQKELEKSLKAWNSTFNAISDIVCVITDDHRFIQINSAGCEALGLPAEEIIGKKCYELIHNTNAPIPVCPCKHTIETLEPSANEYEENGRYYELVAWPIIDSDGNIEAFAHIIRDITDKKKAQKSIREEKEKLKVTIESIGDAVITTDVDGKITLMNYVAEELTGWSSEEAIGKPLTEIFNIISEETGERCENPVEKVIQSGKIVGLANSTILISKNGTRRRIADSGAPIRDEQGNIFGVVLVFRDITEDIKTRQELQKMNRLESLGVLAGGIAHDFNNMLTAIMLNISHSKILSEEGSKIYKLLDDTEKAAMRAQSLTEKLLTFSKGGSPVKETMEIQKVVRESADFVLSGSNTICKYSIPEDIWLVDADAGQISQAIQNIIINADQAMPEGGTIKLDMENVLVDKGTNLPLTPGRYVKISIQDEGIGIPKDYITKIFDPYFTTKQKGNGLGLAITYSIIKKHDGYISLDSKVGKGTTIDIYLPASEAGEQKIKMGRKKITTEPAKILLMDDEEQILEIVKSILESVGHKVETAINGKIAIEKYSKAKEQGKPFDVVILDLTVPGAMGGKEAIKELIQIEPDIKAIVSSGYSNDPVMANYKEYGFSAILSKPYRPNQIIEIVAEIISKSRKD
ncbi:hypothetical protein DRQ33_03090 [bacterium]|nr:MAG: hypothetical protein DRQ33_03090 [bacterium]